MSAWKMGLENAPKDKMIIARFSPDECPVFLKHASYEHEDGNWSGWIWADEMLQDACDPLNAEECADVEWAHVPE